MTSINHIPNLTSLRFVLAFLVVIFHVSEFSISRGFPFFNDWAIFKKGTEAVYVFFTLSGFLIIKKLYDEKLYTNYINLKVFYLKRMLRIFPLYYLVLTFGFIYYHFILQYFGFEFENNYNFLEGIFLSATFFPNIFSTYSPGGILEILWSIGIEEQFYLLIAPIILLLPKKRVLIFLISFTIFYFSIFFLKELNFLAKYQMLFFYFSFGGVCAILSKKHHLLIKKIRLLIFTLTIIYFTTTLFEYNSNTIFYHFFSFILFGLLISSLSLGQIPFLRSKQLNYLGKISYGIYMYHAIVLQFVGGIYMMLISKLNLHYVLDVIIINFLVIALTILISHFSYKYYESYFLNLKHKLS